LGELTLSDLPRESILTAISIFLNLNTEVHILYFYVLFKCDMHAVLMSVCSDRSLVLTHSYIIHITSQRLRCLVVVHASVRKKKVLLFSTKSCPNHVLNIYVLIT